MKKALVLFLFLSFSALGQNLEEENLGKEPHKKTPLSIEKLMEKTNPENYKALTARTPYLLVANYRNGKRWRYFEGDVLRFKTTDGRYFEEDLAFVDDSTFTVYRYDMTARKMEQFTFGVEEVKAVYKNKRGGALKAGLLSMGPFLPMALLDWALYDNPPHTNKDFLWIAPIVGAGNMLIFKHKSLFNKQKLGNNKALKIIAPR